MNNTIITINPKWAQRIYSLEKKYAYMERTGIYSCGDRFFLYETKPVSLITGYFALNKDSADLGYRGPREDIWLFTGKESGFKDKDECFEWLSNPSADYVALYIPNPIKFDRPFKLSDFGVISQPTNFCYPKFLPHELTT